jgi:hypothetical protein
LIAAKSHWHDKTDEFHEYEKIANDGSRPDSEKERANKIVRIVSDMAMRDRNPPLLYIVNKLELAAQFKI